MLKWELKSLEGLTDEEAENYEEKNGVYRLKVDGLELPDVTGLKKKVDELLDEAKTAKRTARELQEKLDEQNRTVAEKSGDIEAVKKSLRDKYDTEVKTLTERNALLAQKLERELVTNVAQAIAAEIAVDQQSIESVRKLIEPRLTVIEKDGEFTTGVKTADGKPSGLTLDEYVKDVQKDVSMSRLLKASSATGGGATNSSKGGGAAHKGNWGGTKEERIAAIQNLANAAN
jgi:Skp family chaperone for outer membrane proteins